MKSMLIIGMGRFGQHLCRNLSELGHQIMIIDKEEDRLEEMLAYSEEAKIGDCTNIEVLKSLEHLARACMNGTDAGELVVLADDSHFVHAVTPA